MSRDRLPDLRVLSLGAGVQSTALALMAASGELPLDVAIFADTGWEPAQVYRQLDRVEVELRRAGIEVFRVREGNLREDALNPDVRFVHMPLFMQFEDGGRALGQRRCTQVYKLKPVNRKIRELLGAKPPNYRYVPRDGRYVEEWIGFSLDELHRVSDKKKRQYIEKRYPLLELEMTRDDCKDYLKAAGWGETAKSACIGCPFAGNKWWRHIKNEVPEEWAEAVEMDESIRNAIPGAQSFLHRSLLPLVEADVDKLSKKELEEEGDPDGCSPYGCISGEAVE